MADATTEAALKYFTPSKGTMSAGELIDEIMPRADRMLKQYDAAAPIIDFATKYWWLVTIAAFAIGIGAGFTANFLYEQAYKRRP